jgi:phosphoribosyl 1,2-cyclic phosphate phosphodiesterase
MLKITILGCGSSSGVPALKYGWGSCDKSNPKNNRMRSSILIQSSNTSLLIDTSPDLRQQLLCLSCTKIDGIVFTHAHYDHVGGMDELRPIFFETNDSINIYSSSEVIHQIKKMFYYLFESHETEICKRYILSNEVSNNFSVGDINCSIFEQLHGKVKSNGIRIGNFAYCTDVSGFSDESFSKLEGLDTWIVGCLSPKKSLNHANIDTVIEWVKKINPRKTFLTHMNMFMDYNTLLNELPKNIRPLYDGMQIVVE